MARRMNGAPGSGRRRTNSGQRTDHRAGVRTMRAGVSSVELTSKAEWPTQRARASPTIHHRGKQLSSVSALRVYWAPTLPQGSHSRSRSSRIRLLMSVFGTLHFGNWASPGSTRQGSKCSSDSSLTPAYTLVIASAYLFADSLCLAAGEFRSQDYCTRAAGVYPHG